MHISAREAFKTDLENVMYDQKKCNNEEFEIITGCKEISYNTKFSKDLFGEHLYWPFLEAFNKYFDDCNTLGIVDQISSLYSRFFTTNGTVVRSMKTLGNLDFKDLREVSDQIFSDIKNILCKRHHTLFCRLYGWSFGFGDKGPAYVKRSLFLALLSLNKEDSDFTKDLISNLQVDYQKWDESHKLQFKTLKKLNFKIVSQESLVEFLVHWYVGGVSQFTI